MTWPSVLPAAIAMGRLVRGVLFGVQPGDPGTLVVAAVALSTVAFIACYLPALRASRVDPVVALSE